MTDLYLKNVLGVQVALKCPAEGNSCPETNVAIVQYRSLSSGHIFQSSSVTV